jgi:hypothetical protein
MEQVFSVLPVMADDQVAYAAHHKAESEKRLVAQNRASAAAQKEREAKEKEAKEKEKAKPPLRPRPPRRDSVPNSSTPSSAEGENQGDANAANRRHEDTTENNTSPVPLSAARLAEIKSALQTIYTANCPEKVHSIDHLLTKYETREEEFLKFVVQKYSVDVSTVPGAQAPNEGGEGGKSPAKPGEVISTARSQDHGKAGRNHEREVRLIASS